MDRAPLPPHERTWRHPSEFNAAVLNAAAARGAHNARGRVVALAGGTFAVVLVAAFFIAVTPRQNDPTAAISATTVPARAALRDATTAAVAAAESIRTSKLAGVTAIPSAIADVPSAAFRSVAFGTEGRAVLPDLDDRVTVLTEQFAYSVAWRDVARLDLDGADAVVVDDDGAVVARIHDGRLTVSHDLLVSSSITTD